MSDSSPEITTSEAGASTDASFQLKVSTDAMVVTLEDIKPACGDGRPVAMNDILAALKKENIIHGIATDKVAGAVTAINSQESNSPALEPLLIASGDSSINGEDGKLIWQIDEEQIKSQSIALLPGELIATYHPATLGKPGKNVYGKPLTVTSGTEITITTGPAIEIIKTEQGDEYRAKLLGTVSYHDNRFDIEPGISVSDDAMSAMMDIHTRSATGSAIELQHILAALAASGIKHGIDEAAIQSALSQHSSSESDHCIKGLLVASGTTAKAGKDARMVVSNTEQVAGQELNDGRFDFHEHGYPRNVQTGDTIGYLLPAKNSENGMTVQGKTIEIPAPKNIELTLKGLHKDERGKLIADIDGALIISGSAIEVVDLLIINGDVSQKTGNVHSNTPVHVKGHVEPGFVLESKKELIIEKNIEDATVRSGSNIVIKGGIRGRHSEVFAPGDISVGFIENAKVFVNGNITIRASIINSEVASNSTIIIGDKRARHSAVMGGTITAHTLVEAITLGSPSFSKTIVRVGIAQETRREINKLESEIGVKQKELADLTLIENRYRKSTSADTATLMHKIEATRQALNADIEKLHTEQAALLATLKESSSAKVVVHKNTLPGVTIFINEQSLEVKHELGKGTFMLGDDGVTFHPG